MFTIGKFAEAGNVGVETVRFYQRKGLLVVPSNTDGARRYGEEDLRRLKFIRKAQTAGFTLEEIKELLRLDAGNGVFQASCRFKLKFMPPCLLGFLSVVFQGSDEPSLLNPSF